MSLTEDIFNKVSAGRTPNQNDFNAGKFFLLLKDPFGLWCNYHAPKEEAVKEDNLYEDLRSKTDRDIRDIWIHEHCKTTIVINAPSEEERFKQTLNAMEQGIEGIIGANLWDLRGEIGCYGGVNLLKKIPQGKSVFGDYHYQIVQLKRAGSMKEHYAMQTALLSSILDKIQNCHEPKSLFIFKSKEQILDYTKLQEKVQRYLHKWRSIKEGSLVPEAAKPPKAALSPWRVYANKYVFEKKDLVLLPHLNSAQRIILRENKINTYEDIVNAGFDKIKELLFDPEHKSNITEDVYYHALAYHYNKPVLRQKGVFPLPPKERNLYFDFETTETFTKDTRSFVYLIGVWDKEEGKFVSFVAKNEAEEEKIFKQFADYMGDPKKAVLYHWTEYEVKKMKELCSKYPAISEDLKKLISTCIDLKIVMEKAFYFPSPSLSLKAAAPAFGFRWRQDDCGAMDSMVYFTKWLKEGDETLLNKVLMYNEDDCRAMLYIEDFLKQTEIIEVKND
ncbi:MAG: TM0106 family RecB-like putative nuclease [Elusimicrobiaceae bacterium]|nr:TM0106 family RecB-like putative nuclease [Elusimicrobiaceae bacterium]